MKLLDFEKMKDERCSRSQVDEIEGIEMEANGCSTPKREEYQIKVLSSPPPPPARKKPLACKRKVDDEEDEFSGVKSSRCFERPSELELEAFFQMGHRRGFCNMASSSHFVPHSPEIEYTDWEKITDPGPMDGSLLNKQDKHRSSSIWTTPTNEALVVRHRAMWEIDERIMPYIVASGFYPWTKVQNMEVDWSLITAFVERWRSETHTFHLRHGEATVTLQDVCLLTGLPVDGSVITGTEEVNWDALCVRLLGENPDRTRSPTMVKRSWFKDNMRILPDDASDEVIQRYARAYILCMLGSTLMPDLSGDRISIHYLPLLEDLGQVRMYSWSSAVLAYLYRQLCSACEDGRKQIGGCTLLLQLWAWERTTIGRPTATARPLPPLEDVVDPDTLGAYSYIRWHGGISYVGTPHQGLTFYRDQLDRQQRNDFIWMPYDESQFPFISATCIEGQQYWNAEVPLICYNIIEWHYPARVLRQFGFKQTIPPCVGACDEKSHDLTRKKKKNWAIELREYIDIWADRAEHTVTGVAEDDDEWYLTEYLQWYYSVTRRFIQPRDEDSQPYRPNAFEHSRYVRALVRDAQLAAQIFLNDTPHSNQQNAYEIFHSCRNDLVEIGEGGALDIDPTLIQFPTEAQTSEHREDTQAWMQSQVTQDPNVFYARNEKRARKRTQRYGFS